MNPNAGEPVSPINPVSGVVPERDMTSDLNNLQELVNAAKGEVDPSKKAFQEQFGPPEQTATISQSAPTVEPPTAEVPALDQQVPSYIPQTAAEIVSQPEQTPAEKLKQQISGSVDAFLEEVTKEKVAA